MELKVEEITAQEFNQIAEETGASILAYARDIHGVFARPYFFVGLDHIRQRLPEREFVSFWAPTFTRINRAHHLSEDPQYIKDIERYADRVVVFSSHYPSVYTKDTFGFARMNDLWVLDDACIRAKNLKDYDISGINLGKSKGLRLLS